MTSVPSLGLNDGRAIPQLGFGTFPLAAHETADIVFAALKVGYRHIDTAEMYGNERGVGDAIRASGLGRAAVFVTSKLDNPWHRPDDARRALDRTLEALDSDYVDLFLIHWPMPRHTVDYVETWRAMESFRHDGRARSIGVSNFEVAHLERLAAETGTIPAVNQVEVHPYHANEAVCAYGAEHGIRTEAWAPLARGAVLTDPVVTLIAERTGRTASQVVLRWHVQRGDIVFPKTTSPARMRENLDIFGFELSAEDMDAISRLDRGESGRIGEHPVAVNSSL